MSCASWQKRPKAQGPAGPENHSSSEPETPAAPAYEGEQRAASDEAQPSASGGTEPSARSSAPAQADAGEAIEGGDETTAVGAVDAAEGDASAPAKRKRKRRKKRKGEGEAGGEHDAAAGEGGEARARRRDWAAPFLRFFVGARAGRSTASQSAKSLPVAWSPAEGCIAVDLFGKAMAYADEFEPREVPLHCLHPSRS